MQNISESRSHKEQTSKFLLIEHWKRKHRDKRLGIGDIESEELQEGEEEEEEANNSQEARHLDHHRVNCKSTQEWSSNSCHKKRESDSESECCRLIGPPEVTRSNFRAGKSQVPMKSIEFYSKIRKSRLRRRENASIASERVLFGGCWSRLKERRRRVGMQTNAKTFGPRLSCNHEITETNPATNDNRPPGEQIRRTLEEEFNCRERDQGPKCRRAPEQKSALKAAIWMTLSFVFLLAENGFYYREQFVRFAGATNVASDEANQSQATAATTAQATTAPLHNNVGDPRPTIYSGQISFGLLLSAHSSMGAEIVGSASHQIQTIFALEDQKQSPRSSRSSQDNSSVSSSPPSFIQLITDTSLRPADDEHDHPKLPADLELMVSADLDSVKDLDEDADGDPKDNDHDGRVDKRRKRRRRRRRQIFHKQYSPKSSNSAPKSHSSSSSIQHCSQVNPNALYAGMGAIWASHQANLVADSHFTIGTYVYDSCNDADVGQRQSVRIVSNLNAFQQTTCESPRGSPISLTIAHGDDQVKAIHLLTSFRVPVISTKEHFAQEAYAELNTNQKKYLFSTAPSSRHLALGALRFARRVAAKSASSPKLPNRLNKSSPRNGLVVISRDLPAGFIAYLSDVAPQLVNYELLTTKLPIDQISSIQRLESIFMKQSARQLAQQVSSESRQISTKTKAPPGTSSTIKPRVERRSMDSGDSQLDSGSQDSGPESGSSASDSSTKMLSPTILMFITPAEAIDLITRLRNNMAEVSKYYSLIIVTREDITPALKTIFQRGGSSLCSGKAFYTVSPKPDDMSEFSRYFRDTVHIEGETSDHPLVCEYAKHAASSRIATDYDDVAAEPVVKAVWAAAAAFKQVHARECGSLAGASSPAINQSNFYKGAGPSSTGTTSMGNLQSSSTHNPNEPSGMLNGNKQAADPQQQQQQQQIRSVKARQSSGSSAKSAHSECMMKMSKTMSQLVQKALRKINVSINSTGLQSLDGFQISFDDLNELNSNKFSIRHINKECEIEEIGQYTGQKGSQLHLDNAAILKSMESTLPDAWPVTLAPSTNSASSPASSSDSASNKNSDGSSSKDSSANSDGSSSSDGASSDGAQSSNPSWLGEQPAGTSTQQSRRKRPPASSQYAEEGSNNNNNPNNYYKREPAAETDSSPGSGDGSGNGEDGDIGGNSPGESSVEPSSFHHRTSKRSKATTGDGGANNNPARNRPRPTSIRTSGAGRAGQGNSHIGLTDAPEQVDSTTTPATTASMTSTTTPPEYADSEPNGSQQQTSVKPMRQLKPYHPTTEGAKLKDWIPKEEDQEQQTTTLAPNKNQKAASAGRNQSSPTRSPSLVYQHSTLPESGGNTDLEIPALATTRASKQSSSRITTKSKQEKDGGPVTASESSDVVTMASVISQHATNKHHLALPNRAAKSGNPTAELPSWASTLSPQSKSGAASSNMDSGASTTMSSVTLKPFGRQGFSFDTGHDFAQTNTKHEQNNFRSPFRDLDLNPVALSSESPILDQTHQSIKQQQLPSSGFIGHPGANVDASSSDGPDPMFRLQPQAAVSEPQKLNRSKLRIYNSWFGIVILIANILGAILTLYVLTFLLMKNCDGSLDRDNQNARSMHLLAIIVVFFGSTLFIVSPTPGLCLLRASWHNFALVLVFGCLLSQSMQTRSMRTIGLGGRPNRLNQFLNLVFLVGVQVSFELQRWKYESANYLNFVNQYFGSPESDHKKLMILGNAIANQFNPLDSFNDLVTPVSIQVSEKYQNLLQDYCIQQTDDFMQSQIYLCIIVALSILFSCLTRNYSQHHGRSQNTGLLGNRSLRSRFLGSGAASAQDQAALAVAAASMTSGKLVASEHEANLNIAPIHHSNPMADSASVGASFQVSNLTGMDNGMLFIVSSLNGFIYVCSIMIHIYGQNNGSNRDLVSSVTMVLIAFVTLIGVFLPILNQIHRSDSNRRPILSSSTLHRGNKAKLNFAHVDHAGHHRQLMASTSAGSASNLHLSSAFTMFPEFSPTGLNKPTGSLASLGDDRSTSTIAGSGSRKPFAETKESRRKMGFTLANLAMDHQFMGPGASGNVRDSYYRDQHQLSCDDDDILRGGGGADDSAGLRGMGFYDPEVRETLEAQFRDSSMISMKLNEALLNEDHQQPDHHHHHQHHQRQHHDQHQTKTKSANRLSKVICTNSNVCADNGDGCNNEKRLIMLDVDPCCPKHGIGSRPSQSKKSSN